LISNNKTMSR